MLKIIETFSGIGSQVQALKNTKIKYSVEAIVEWEIGAMFAYDIIHNGPQNLSMYRHHTKGSLLLELEKYNLSGDGNQSLSDQALSSMSVGQLKSILHAIVRTNNLVDITAVKAADLPNADVLTYSFPCQDLSISGHWHNIKGGIERDANNRSTLLWEIERLLTEYVEMEKTLPKFLLMENVSNILSDKHIDNFLEWQQFLERLGYVNQVYTLDARDFGIPQSRKRTYMISVLSQNERQMEQIMEYFFLNNLEQVDLKTKKNYRIEEFLRLDYSVDKYREEAIHSTPSFTPSRQKIYENNIILATDDKPNNHEHARTITTKQDRHPNSGIIEYENICLTDINKNYRNLTPRECFLLMGFTEEQFDCLLDNNLDLGAGRKFLANSKLIRLAGNSIVVPVLEQIFKQINEINKEILSDTKEGMLV